jgi:hypothetical protein
VRVIRPEATTSRPRQQRVAERTTVAPTETTVIEIRRAEPVPPRKEGGFFHRLFHDDDDDD